MKPFEDTDSISIDIEEQKYEISKRNKDGVANLLTLPDNATTILSLPEKEASKILIHLKTYNYKNDPIIYKISQALIHEFLYEGKIYNKEDVYRISNTFLENELELTGERALVFTKHSAIADNYSPIIQKYFTTFDSSTNTAIIQKPILNEKFTFTVIVGEKGSLNHLSQCDLAFNDKSKFGKYSKTFVLVSNNIITHYIDFESIDFSENTEFDLFVFAEQTENSKMEFLYPVIT